MDSEQRGASCSSCYTFIVPPTKSPPLPPPPPHHVHCPPPDLHDTPQSKVQTLIVPITQTTLQPPAPAWLHPLHCWRFWISWSPLLLTPPFLPTFSPPLSCRLTFRDSWSTWGFSRNHDDGEDGELVMSYLQRFLTRHKSIAVSLRFK